MFKYLLIIMSLIQLQHCCSGNEVRVVSANLDANPNTYLLDSWKKGCPKEVNVSKGQTDGRSKFCEATYMTGMEEMEHVTSEISPKYYRIEYNIINKSKSNQTVSLAILIDTMIDDNDGIRVAIYKDTKTNLTQVDNENSFSGNEVPKQILLFHTGNDITKLTGEVVFKRRRKRSRRSADWKLALFHWKSMGNFC